ncbi:hypothetical protein CEXT_736811 [Caerostris extrusa]|uniref:Uncharacterized protein n=1 Tax=Caerostris extrusa TaxID=172846 RepID=A0AAV4XWU9_CAEEX|nr:hypothetical protein CEXT_736811 [Caerostris extrusa]
MLSTLCSSKFPYAVHQVSLVRNFSVLAARPPVVQNFPMLSFRLFTPELPYFVHHAFLIPNFSILSSSSLVHTFSMLSTVYNSKFLYAIHQVSLVRISRNVHQANRDSEFLHPVHHVSLV